jgi:hypothetical protein
MRSNHILSVLVVGTAVFALAGFLFWLVAGVQAETAVDLELISEKSGFVAELTAVSPDCFFDSDYQLYLCEPPAPARQTQSNPTARAEAMALLSGGGALFIIDSTVKRLMVFDPLTGDLVDPAFIGLDDEATGTAIHALIGPNDTILISDQTRDVVHEYDLNGNYLGIFAPIGGANTSILDNIRGMALRPNGNLLVTVAASANANAVAEFDSDGNYLGNFIANGSGGLNSPFDIYQREETDWLVSSINSDEILRYGLADGAPLGQFVSINSFPQQIFDTANGNVLVSNFSGVSGVHEFTSDGSLVGIYAPSGLSGYRGVYELGNGNLLASTSGGVFEIDRSGNLVAVKYEGVGRFVQFVNIAGLDLRKTVGLDSSVCANSDEVAVPANTAVTYCFEITNNTGITLTLHDLADSHLGAILDGLAFGLTPGASAFITQTAVITQTTINTATWTAYNPGPVDVFTAADTATVTILQPAISLTKTVGLDSSACAETDEIDVAEGTAVTYCFKATNSGGVPLAWHDLEDSHLGQILDGLSFTLQPGATVFITQTAVITQPTTNTAVWTAYNAGPTDLVTATDSATVNILTSAVSLAKTVGTDSSTCALANEITVLAGTPVTYCYEVTNSGEVPLSVHDLEDSELGALLTAFNFVLQPGATVFITQTAVITQSVTNTAVWTAYNPGPYALATDSASATVNVVNPAVALTVTVGLDADVCAADSAITVAPDTIVAYCYTVSNVGDLTLEEHTISDSLWGLIDSFPFTLEPGMSVSLIYTQTITADTVSTASWLAESGSFQAEASAEASVLVAEVVEQFYLYLPIILKP